jgi:hypothetical protein
VGHDGLHQVGHEQFVFVLDLDQLANFGFVIGSGFGEEFHIPLDAFQAFVHFDSPSP